MQTATAKKKITLLLSPQRITTDYLFLGNLHIQKLKDKISFQPADMDVDLLLKEYGEIPKPARNVMRTLSPTGINLIKTDIKNGFAIRRSGSGLSFDTYFKTAMARRLHELFAQLQPYASLLEWYHSVSYETGKFRTAPCSFSAFKPVLQFEVQKNNGAFQLHTNINLNGSIYNIGQFRRFGFLLESTNEYFLLSYKDYQTLEWLHHNPQEYIAQHEFEQNLLVKLEPGYPVNRNDLFVKTEINALPLRRVLLSEISNSFLVFTPQWFYDGFLVEGQFAEKIELVRNGESFVINRNRESEFEFISLLESLHPNFGRQLNGYYYLSFAEAQKKSWFLKVYRRLLEMNVELAGMDMLNHFRYSQHKPLTKATILKEEHDTITLDIKVSFGTEESSIAELQKILLAGGTAILLKDGSLGILDEEWLKKNALLIRHAKVSGKHVTVSRWTVFSQQQSNEAFFQPVISSDWQKKWFDWRQSTEALYAVPSSVHAELRPYQHKGFEWMVLLAEAGAGACLADDMGLGKTLQTICFLAYRLELNKDARHLIICPSSLIYNWKKEFERFAPAVSVVIYHGTTRDANVFKNSSCNIIITSYGTVRSDIDTIRDHGFDCIVLDESHNIKNPDAQLTRAACELNAASRVALSGTPVMNNTFDLFAQLNFLVPGLLGGREFFKREYADAIDRDNDEMKIKSLQKLTAPFVLRRTKSQVAKDLPEKTEMVMWCSMGADQKAIYNEVKNSIRESVFLSIKNDGLNKSKFAVLIGMLRLRQICNSPLLLPENERSFSGSVKTELIVDELKNNLKDHKVLLFSQFAGMLDLLASEFRKQGISFYHFDGQTPPAKRAEMVEAFQDPDCKTNAFLMSLKAGNAGLNLTAADYVFLIDPWWNTAVQQQAIDRTHRIGQTKQVFAYNMICKDSIEEKIMELQKRKKQLAEELVSEENGFVKSLTEEDIGYLFS